MDDMYCDEVCVSSCSANPTTNSKIHLCAQVYEFSRIDKCEIKQQQQLFNTINGILLPKLFWPTVRKNCSSDREKF